MNLIKYTLFCLLLPAFASAEGVNIMAFGEKFQLPEAYVFNVDSLNGAAHFISNLEGRSSFIYFGKISDCSFCKESNSNKYIGFFGSAKVYKYSSKSKYSDYVNEGILFIDDDLFMLIFGVDAIGGFWEELVVNNDGDVRH